MLLRALGVSARDLTPAVIEALVTSKTFESSIVEFKRDLPDHGVPESIDKFVKTVCSFANSSGGVIVYGVKEDNDAAARLHPVELGKQPSDLSKVIRARIMPLLRTFEWHVIRDDGATTGFFVLEIAPSPLYPHAVQAKDGLGFWRRSSRDRDLMTESEVERAYRHRRDLLLDIEQQRQLLIGRSRKNTRVGCVYVGAIPIGTGPRSILPLQKIKTVVQSILPHLQDLHDHSFVGGDVRLQHRRVEISRSWESKTELRDWGMVGDLGEIMFCLEAVPCAESKERPAVTDGYLYSTGLINAVFVSLHAIGRLSHELDVFGPVRLFWGIEGCPIAFIWTSGIGQKSGILEEAVDNQRDMEFAALDDKNLFLDIGRDILFDLRSAFGLGGNLDWITQSGVQESKMLLEGRALVVQLFRRLGFTVVP